LVMRSWQLQNFDDNLVNDRPIIGIIDQPNYEWDSQYGTTYIPASYVKWAESSGARVAPIYYNSTLEQLEVYFNSINGLIFTGGSLDLTPDDTYFQTANYFFQRSIKAFEAGDYFPIWGTCQGYQLLSILAADNVSVLLLNAYESENLPLPLIFTSVAKSSRLIGNIPGDLFLALSSQNITINLHHDGVPPEYYQNNPKLSSFFDLLSWNYDRKNKPFGSLIESKIYPIYGSQFHPERNQFEWDILERVSHSQTAVRASQYFGEFFINECRKNFHQFNNTIEEANALIYNYIPTFTGNEPPDTIPDQQTYFFNWS